MWDRAGDAGPHGCGVGTPVVVMSAGLREPLAEEADHHGADRHLAKPFALHQLLELVATFCA